MAAGAYVVKFFGVNRLPGVLQNFQLFFVFADCIIKVYYRLPVRFNCFGSCFCFRFQRSYLLIKRFAHGGNFFALLCADNVQLCFQHFGFGLFFAYRSSGQDVCFFLHRFFKRFHQHQALCFQFCLNIGFVINLRQMLAVFVYQQHRFFKVFNGSLLLLLPQLFAVFRLAVRQFVP